MRKKRVFRRAGMCVATDKLPFARRIEGNSFHPSSEGHGERREVYSVSFSLCAEMVCFPGYPHRAFPIFIIYL
jgi:hypothetical protein